MNPSSPDSPRKPRRPRPIETTDTAFFWEAAQRHRLGIQRCCGCGVLRHPPMPACARCHSLQWDVVESAGRGQLVSYTVVHAPLQTPWDRPYAVGLVQLDEGTRLVAQLDGDVPSAWRIGERLKVGFVDCEGDFTLPVLRREEGDT